MPYIGHSPTQAGSYIEVDDFGSSFNGSNVAFTLQVGGVNITPNQQNLLVMIDGVLQQPSNAFSVSGSTITFTEAPVSGADLYCLLMGQSASVGQGTIGADELKVSGDGSDGQVLKSDGDGTFTWLSQDDIAAGTLANARTINGVSFNGSANITVTADANTLSNTTLKSTVVNSSLTSVGTIGTGVWQGTKVASAYLDDDTAHLSGSAFTGTISSSTGSTTDSVLTLSDAGVADYKFTFPDTSTIRLSTNTTSTKVFDLLNAGSGKMKLSVDGGLKPITGSDYSLVLESTNELNFYNADGYADSNRATLHINYSGTGSSVDLANSELVVTKGTGSTFGGDIVGKTNSSISYSSGDATTTATGGAFNASGSDIVTGRLFIQGYQNTGTDLIGFNSETNQLVLYNYTDGAYLMKIAHGATLSADFGASMLNLYNNDTGSAGSTLKQLSLGKSDNTAWNATNSGTFTGIAVSNSSNTDNSACGVAFTHRTGSSGISYIVSRNEGSDASSLHFGTRGTGGVDSRLDIGKDGDIYVSAASDNKASINLIASGSGQAPNDAKCYVQKNSSNDWSFSGVGGGDDYGLKLNGAGSNAIYVTDHNQSSAVRFKVQFNGYVYSTDGSIHDIDSDERKKEDISLAESQWQILKDLPLQKFKWKDKRAGDKYSYGWIAQDVQEKYPELVNIVPQTKEDIENEVEDPEYLTVMTGDIHRLAIKALQEAMAKIETLESKVEALENA